MSMTTELAQRMKAAALKAKQANDLYLEGKITLSECVVETKDHLDYSDNPNNTLALVEALEALRHERDELQQGFIANQEEAREAIKYATELKEQLARARSGCEEAVREVEGIQKILDHIHRRRVIWRGKAVTADAENAVLRQRIAELEARTFKVEMPDAFYPDGDTEVPYVLQEDEVIAAIVAAGGTPIAICRLCKSKLNLSHRPDGSHYCHSSSAGVAVEGE